MNIRPLTAEDLAAWWRGTQTPRTVRGFAVEHEGEIKGVAGVMYLPSRLLAFAEMGEDGANYPLTIMRVARMMRALMLDIGVPIFAEADPQYPNAPGLLERVGFVHVQGNLYEFKKEGR